jgi:serine/threonine-protein kinase HipA
MVFNIIGMNCDDHVKNFSFMMDRGGEWKMPPAYDITFAYKPDNKWLGSHQMTMNGKSSGIDSDDILDFGHRIGLGASFCKGVISEVAETVGSWMKYADKCGIHEDRATEIAEMLNMTGFVSIRS